MVIEEAHRHFLERPGRRGDLRDNVRAPPVVFDHLLDATYLALDFAQSGQVVVLISVSRRPLLSAVPTPSQNRGIGVPGRSGATL
jgi:hypothetical protein